MPLLDVSVLASAYREDAGQHTTCLRLVERLDAKAQPVEQGDRFLVGEAGVVELADPLGLVDRADLATAASRSFWHLFGTVLGEDQAQQRRGVEHVRASHAPPRAAAPRSVPR